MWTEPHRAHGDPPENESKKGDFEGGGWDVLREGPGLGAIAIVAGRAVPTRRRLKAHRRRPGGRGDDLGPLHWEGKAWLGHGMTGGENRAVKNHGGNTQSITAVNQSLFQKK